jgi:hypothetical protein
MSGALKANFEIIGPCKQGRDYKVTILKDKDLRAQGARCLKEKHG